MSSKDKEIDIGKIDEEMSIRELYLTYLEGFENEDEAVSYEEYEKEYKKGNILGEFM
ncbi:MAG: hypothetical protein KC589_05245 [Nanoarchaeota archaeon]|nr:hypothetical protein [Nanoarchaeota archaeon]